VTLFIIAVSLSGLKPSYDIDTLLYTVF